MAKRLRTTKSIVERPLYAAIVLKPVLFSSGRVALVPDQRVWMQVSERYTTWVWDRADLKNQKLLYTFNREQQPWKYLAYLEER